MMKDLFDGVRQKETLKQKTILRRKEKQRHENFNHSSLMRTTIYIALVINNAVTSFTNAMCKVLFFCFRKLTLNLLGVH